MKTLYIHINNDYGGACRELHREYKSVDDFKADIARLKALTAEEVKRDYGSHHPLSLSEPELVEIQLADDETYRIDEYDGMERIEFYKLKPITSKFVKITKGF